VNEHTPSPQRLTAPSATFIVRQVIEGSGHVDDSEPEKVLPVGGTFFEPCGAVHTTNGSARTDGPTRAVVFMLVPKGSPLTSPA
jgi:quercetin dioxygenase-like cupin family protein